MDDKVIPDELLQEMTYEQFKDECQRVMNYNDDTIKQLFKELKVTPDEIRNEYKSLLESVTSDDYKKQKNRFDTNSLKSQGNSLFREEKYREALDKYTKALSYLEEINKDDTTEQMKETLILNLALAHSKLNQHEQTIIECNKVQALS